MSEVLRFFWLIVAAIALANGIIWRKRLEREAAAHQLDESAVHELIDRVLVGPMVVLCCALGVLQLLAKAPTPLEVFCRTSHNPHAVASIALMAMWSALVVGYVWYPSNSSKVAMATRLVGGPTNVWLGRAVVTLSQAGFWAAILVAGLPCDLVHAASLR
jgi:hypothetical protein